jgi:hypothetical protein
MCVYIVLTRSKSSVRAHIENGPVFGIHPFLSFHVMNYIKTRSIPRALLRELRISGLHGMMTWTTKCLRVLLTWTLHLHVLVDFNCM